MDRLDWKRCGVGLGLWVGLGAAVFACSGDDSTTPGDSGTTGDAPGVQAEASVQDARADVTSSLDSSRQDAVGPESGADASTTPDADAAVAVADADADADAALRPPTPLNLCDTLDSFWNDEPRSDVTAWPSMIVSGPPGNFSDGGANPDPDVGLIGYINVGDCTVGGVYANGLSDSISWQNQLTPFEYQFFGCAEDAGADAGPLGFALVPPNMYGQPFGPDDLARLGDWFVASVIQAVLNQSANNPNALLTPAQIDQMYAEMAYQETLYPNIIQAPGYHYSTCPDAGPEAGGD